jgi:NADH-quinone oxidoreductase subunit J
VLIASMRATELGEFNLPNKTNIGFVEEVGKKLFTDFLLPFEISSVLFLSAMIGSVLLAKKEKK